MYTTCLSRHSTAISLVMHLAPAGKMGSCNCGMDSSVWLTWSAGASQKVAQAHSSDSRRRGVDFRRSEAERCGRVGLMHRGKLLAVGTPGEVKKLMQGTILEIRSSEPRRATAILREQFTTATASLFGDRIHLLAQHPDQ